MVPKCLLRCCWYTASLLCTVTETVSSCWWLWQMSQMFTSLHDRGHTERMQTERVQTCRMSAKGYFEDAGFTKREAWQKARFQESGLSDLFQRIPSGRTAVLDRVKAYIQAGLAVHPQAIGVLSQPSHLWKKEQVYSIHRNMFPLTCWSTTKLAASGTVQYRMSLDTKATLILSDPKFLQSHVLESTAMQALPCLRASWMLAELVASRHLKIFMPVKVISYSSYLYLYYHNYIYTLVTHTAL